MKALYLIAAAAIALMAAGCAHEKPTDYGPYLDHMPKSILVLPPLNETAEVGAADAFLSTITIPLAERGYYVFPIAIADQYMKENGLPTPGEMHQVAPAKLGDVFGADAILYIAIKEWTTKYMVIDSSTVMKMAYRLVDARSAAELWRWDNATSKSEPPNQQRPERTMTRSAKSP